LVNHAATFLGGIDILVNNTGDLIGRRKIEDLDLEFWRRVLDVNLTSTMLVTRHAVPHLAAARQGSMVNLASLAGRMCESPSPISAPLPTGFIGLPIALFCQSNYRQHR